MRQLALDLRHAGTGTDLVLVAARRAADADLGQDLVMCLDGGTAGEGRDVRGRCQGLPASGGYFVRTTGDWLVVVTWKIGPMLKIVYALR